MTRSTLTEYLPLVLHHLRTGLLAAMRLEEVTVATTTGRNLVILAQPIKAMIAPVLSVAFTSGSASMDTCLPSIPVTLRINPH